jgi:HK97 family phage major capsid protein
LPYDNLISRTDAAALIPEDVSREIWQDVVQQSAALQYFRQVRMSRAQTRLPVLAALPTAYFVDGDTGLKQTSEVNWANKYLNAEEIAVIIPIAEAVLDDADYDVWSEIRPLAAEAIGRTFDAAAFFGTNKPASWPTAIVDAAEAAGNEVTRGTAAQAAGGIATDISNVMAKVEADGYDPNLLVTTRATRALLRNARATDGQRLLDFGGNAGTVESVMGLPVAYSMNGIWGSSAGDTELIALDRRQFIVGIRQDITYKVLDQAVIQDNTGAILYNLAQQDMVALRIVFRAAFAVPNPINYTQGTEANRYPAAVLERP